MTGEPDIVDRLIGDAEAWREKLSDFHPLETEVMVNVDGVRETIEILEAAANKIVDLRFKEAVAHRKKS